MMISRCPTAQLNAATTATYARKNSTRWFPQWTYSLVMSVGRGSVRSFLINRSSHPKLIKMEIQTRRSVEQMNSTELYSTGQMLLMHTTDWILTTDLLLICMGSQVSHSNSRGRDSKKKRKSNSNSRDSNSNRDLNNNNSSNNKDKGSSSSRDGIPSVVQQIRTSWVISLATHPSSLGLGQV